MVMPQSFTLLFVFLYLVLAAMSEILILGCGKRMGSVSQEVRYYLRSNGIKLEAIDMVSTQFISLKWQLSLRLFSKFYPGYVNFKHKCFWCVYG